MEGITTISLAIVDDSSTDSETFADLLRQQGLSINSTQFHSNDELRSTNDSGDPIDLYIFCPDRSRKVLSQIVELANSQTPPVPVIVITENYDRASALAYFEQGANDTVAIGENDYLVASIIEQYENLQNTKNAITLKNELKQTQQSWKKLVEQASLPIAYLTEGIIVQSNSAFNVLLQQTDLADVSLIDLVSKDSANELKRVLPRLYSNEATTTTLDIEFVLNNKNIRVKTKLGHCFFNGEPGISLLIDDNRALAAGTSKQGTSKTTPQVDFINIEQFFEEAQSAINLAKDTSMGGCIGILEIDDFQAVKDTLGITVSDTLLEELSRYILESLSNKVNLSRLGNGAFVFLLNFIDTQTATTLMDELRIKIANHKVVCNNQTLSLTCSIGLVAVTDRNDSVDELMAYADTACRVARQQGGNVTHLYDSFKDYDLSQTTDLDWKVKIEFALSQGSFRLLFQPITNIKKRPSVHRYEVLVRMLEEENEILPSQFLHAAKQSGLEHRIDKWIVLNAIQQLHIYAKSEQQIELFIKLSSESIQDNTFPVWLQSMLESIDIGHHKLCFEIDSNICQSMLPRIRVLVPDLINLGAKTCIEHFGKDKSHFNLLGNVHFDYLKIDGSLVSHVVHDRKNQFTIKQIADMCAKSKTKVIAVSVQDTNSVSFLWQSGITNIQGYYVRPPSPYLDYDFETSI